MKKISIILPVFLAILALTSCDDSYGIDPNVRETIVNPPDVEEPPVDNSFPIKNTNFYFREFYETLTGQQVGITWGQYVAFDKRIVRIDTLADIPVLTIQIEARQIIPDNMVTDMPDRITHFRLELEIEMEETQNELNLIGPQSDKKWTSVRILDVYTEQSPYFTSSAEDFTARVYYSHDEEIGEITGVLGINLIMVEEVSTFYFDMQFLLDYKN